MANRARENADGVSLIKKQFAFPMAAESLARKAVASLDARQAIFAAKYVETFDIPTASKAAGYESNYGAQVLKHPLVARAVQLLQTDKLHQIESSLPVNAEMIINGIVRNIHALEARGKNEATFKGYELLGKHLSMWTEKIDITTDTHTLSPEDRASKIAALVALASARAANNIIDVEHTPKTISPTGDDLL